MNDITTTPQRHHNDTAEASPKWNIVPGSQLAQLVRKRSNAQSSGGQRDSILEHITQGGDIMLVAKSGCPLSYLSILPFQDNRLSQARRKGPMKKQPKSTLASQYLEMIGLPQVADVVNNMATTANNRRKKTSYVELLMETGCLGLVAPEVLSYLPLLLDNPEHRTGKNRTIITLPCFIGSIISYSRPSDIKRELNEHFRDTHPSVDPSLTLTQIRKLKQRMVEIGKAVDLEVTTVAFAIVYLEKLILKTQVNKASRKLIAAVCLFLAIKVNESIPTKAQMPPYFSSIMACIEDKLGPIGSKEVYSSEFAVYALLDFNLFLPMWEIEPHLQRIQSSFPGPLPSDPNAPHPFYEIGC
ncbi:uncharacterized protein BJ171DRAFT_223644 [Polychytrium aggregatum]|uniref:uncharacterized protein n=1 Tax=Polychytrium aggregatum TaxID=110093 RepID=UPI0022FE3218|nr:uncharacterized protein BJ171DRAFT_223644 [Polychytrium aggregatum]KAI9197401.1 hypothetical protein BJ171DRAFT_223644 [Polychytrium aggregatum]